MTGELSDKRWLIIGGMVSLAAWGWLASQSQSYGDAGLFEVLFGTGAAFVISFALWFYYEHSVQQPSLPVLLLFALLFRLVGLWSFPLLEDDFYRYLWDGRQFIEVGNPYLLAPSHFFAAEGISEAFQDILDNINHPDVATVYGPVNQYLFALAYWIAPGAVWPLQLLCIVLDMGVVLLLAKMVQARHLLLYAWSPLVIKEFAFTAHPDVFGVFFVVAALYLYQLGRHLWLVPLCLALALGVKVFAIVVVPFLLGFRWRQWLLFTATCVAVALPFGVVNAWYPEGLQAMAGQWLFNAPLYMWLTPLIEFSWLKAALLAVYAAGWLYALWAYLSRRIKAIPGEYLYLGLLLAAPVFNPWYLVWLLAFACLRPALWSWVLSFSVLLSYVSGINLEDSGLALYQQPGWAVALEFTVVLVAFVVDWRQGRLPWLSRLAQGKI